MVWGSSLGTPSENNAIAARELHRWAHEAMQMGALADGGKGKRKTCLQGPEYQGLADNTADGSRAKRSKFCFCKNNKRLIDKGPFLGSWRRSAQQAECPAQALATRRFLFGRIEEENRHAADTARRAPTRVVSCQCACADICAWACAGMRVRVCMHLCVRGPKVSTIP